MSLFPFLLVSVIGCGFCLWHFLDFSVYLFALSKLRLSSHRLLIESGRWNRPELIPREHRLCAICNYLEDEYDLLFEFSLYNNERVGFLKPYYLRRKSMFKAVVVMQSSNAKVLKNLAVYIYKC